MNRPEIKTEMFKILNKYTTQHAPSREISEEDKRALNKLRIQLDKLK
jgi:hypothetical protein